MELAERIEEILIKVEKPARYAGGEFNAHKPDLDADLRFLMCFPDVYEVAFSNLGIKILSEVLSGRQGCSCETACAPWPDMGYIMKERGIPLFSLESRSGARDFDMLGFSMQYELSYTNMAYMLDLAGIPFLAKDRGESEPLIVCGGPCMTNPMPVADFCDFIVIGDGEEVIGLIADRYIANKKTGGKKTDFLRAIAALDGIYVPSLAQKKVKRAIVQNLDKAPFPTKLQIPNTEAVHNRAVLEVFRGCTRGCRFCQAGMIYRPLRERSADTLTKQFEALCLETGYDEISLSSLSTCDYSDLKNLLAKIKPIAEKHRVNIALPSSRVDSFEAEFIEGARKSSLTFAPEAGTQRLRDVINKNVTETDILSTCAAAFSKGYASIKLYFMIGLPTETDEDIAGIVKLAKDIKALYARHRTSKKSLSLTVSTSTFVPKPFTPFQWEAQISLERIKEIQFSLRDALKKERISFRWHDSKTSRTEAAFARGDRRLSAVIISAYKSGCFFDGWSEFFSYEKWEAAFAAHGLCMDGYTGGIDTGAELFWDFIDAGVTKEFLLRERENALGQKTTPDCRGKCAGCGIIGLTGRPCL